MLHVIFTYINGLWSIWDAENPYILWSNVRINTDQATGIRHNGRIQRGREELQDLSWQFLWGNFHGTTTPPKF